MGNFMPCEITQGWIMNDKNYIFNHDIMECENVKALVIFYKHNNEENIIKFNLFLENISNGLILQNVDKYIAFIKLKYYSMSYVIFYALYEKNIYEYLISICNMYTFIDKEPNSVQQNDSHYKSIDIINIQTIHTSNNFSELYLIEFIFRSLCLYDDCNLYNNCIVYKSHLYDAYKINPSVFADKLIKLLIIKYNYIYSMYDYNKVRSIMYFDVITLQLICKSKSFGIKSQNFLSSVNLNGMFDNDNIAN